MVFASLARLLGGTTKPQPPSNDDVEVFPAHHYDDNDVLRKIMISWTLCFDDVLDADKINDALQKLLEKEGWRKLGGRLRLNVQGRLEVHVPRTFTADQPAVRYTHSVLDMSIGDHPVASKLPRPTDNLSVQSMPADMQHALGLKGVIDPPGSVEDLIKSGEPQVSLHIVSFADATLVVLSFPHTMTDAMGQKALVEAWSQMVAGREEDVPALAGTRDDILATVGTELDTTEPEPWVLESRVMTGFRKFVFGMYFLWDLIWCPQAQEKALCIPPSVMRQLRQQAQQNLVNGEDGKPPFISEGDVLNAWMVGLVARSQPKPRAMSLLNVVEVRSRLRSLFNPKNPEVYIQNLVFRSQAFLTATESVGLSLGATAIKVREAIVQQVTEPQLRAQIRAERKATKAGEGYQLLGESNAMLLVFTNWSKCDFFNVIDFSAAVVGAKAEGRINPPGRIFYHHGTTVKKDAVGRNFVTILGKDHAGNYWVKPTLGANVWPKLEEQVVKVSEAMN